MSQPETQTQTSGADGGGEHGLREVLDRTAFAIDGIGGAATPTPKLLRILADHLDGIRRIENIAGHARSLRGRADFLDETALAARAALAAPAAKGGTDLRREFDEYDITQDMIQAGRYAANLKDGTLARIYLAMRAAEIAASPTPPAGAAGGGSGDLAALSAGALPSNAADRLLAVQHPKYPLLHVVGWEFSDAEEGIRLVREALSPPTPDIGAQGDAVASGGKADAP